MIKAAYLSIFESVANASKVFRSLDIDTINRILIDVAKHVEIEIPFLIEENKKDLERMDATDPKYDRLKLTEDRIKAIASDIRNVASLSSPIDTVLSEKTLENGLKVSKVTVPLGVIGIIYEARPNVTLDVFSLCLKSSNACVLKGGSDAAYSNKAIITIIHKVLDLHGVNKDIVQLLPIERESTEALLNAVGYVDVIIPRGSQQLINFVRDHAKVPVIETGAGIVHTYIDKSADIEKATDIVFNAKTRRVSVCNALDCLIIHSDRINDLISICAPLGNAGVEIFADETAYATLNSNYPSHLLFEAKEEHFGTEFLSMKLSIKTVHDLNNAIEHIDKYSSKHSEAIVSEDKEAIRVFLKRVDAAAVYANTSTAFTDGAQFGLGAEIGISTQKLHARGPMALAELTSYKWLVIGHGQTRK